MLILDISRFLSLPQRNAELIDHLHPVGVLQNRLAQKGGLGWRPEGGFGEAEIAVQGGVAGDEVLDAGIVIRQPQLGEEVFEVVHGLVHAAMVLLIGVVVKSGQV
jgi:hypothetical protein